jgi:urea transport system substrate-binding protein
VLIGAVFGAVAAAGGITVALLKQRKDAETLAPVAPAEPIPVGVLHSSSGTMAVSETPVIDATALAIDEINAAGGVLGRPLKPVPYDGKSDPEEFARAAEKLLTDDRAAVIFGCWTSASRKAVRPVVERRNGALFYPVQYEGLEQSPRIVYLGPAANQQITPAVEYAVQKLKKKRLFLIGSDYVYPRAANEVIRDDVNGRRGDGIAVVGEEYLPLGSKDVDEVVAAVRAARPDVIFNTVNGSSNFTLFRALEAAGPPVSDVPVISFSLMETDLRRMDPKETAGNYLVGTYFQSIGSPSGKAFLDKFRAKYGPEKTFSDPMAAAYTGVHLWAKAATAAGTVDPTAVLKAVRGLSFDGPDGPVKIDPDTASAWLPVRIGQVQPDGAVKVVSGSKELIRPDAFPPPKTRRQWEQFLHKLQDGWDGRWQAPGTGS